MHHVQEALPVKAVVQGHYLVEAVLSRGEAGNTYLVRDKRLGQQRFILKEIVHAGGKARYRFPVAPELLQQLEHPALPHVHHTFTDVRRGRSYLLIEFIVGSSAASLLSKRPGQRLRLSETMELMTPIMESVAYLHRQQTPIIHRDIKPSNIIISASGRGSFLVDFGLAKLYDAEATTSVLRYGSPGYCAPEQYGHQGTSPRTDIYALGATFYKCLTGIVPIESSERVLQLCEAKNDPLVPLDERMPDLPSSVVAAIHRALDIDSDRRFANVEQFWEALQGWRSADTGGVQQEEESHTLVSMLEAKDADTTSSDSRSTPVLVGKESKGDIEVNSQALPLSRKRRKRYLTAGALAALAAIFLLSIGMSFGLLHIPSANSTGTSTGQVARPHTSGPAVQSVGQSYQGTIYNLVGNTKGVMSLIDVQRQQHKIRGTFQGPLGKGLFLGMIDASGHIQFVATNGTGQTTFSFDGAVRGDGTLAGSYCQPVQGGKCSSYGLWSVVPAGGASAHADSLVS